MQDEELPNKARRIQPPNAALISTFPNAKNSPQKSKRRPLLKDAAWKNFLAV